MACGAVRGSSTVPGDVTGILRCQTPSGDSSCRPRRRRRLCCARRRARADRTTRARPGARTWESQRRASADDASVGTGIDGMDAPPRFASMRGAISSTTDSGDFGEHQRRPRARPARGVDRVRNTCRSTVRQVACRAQPEHDAGGDHQHRGECASACVARSAPSTGNPLGTRRASRSTPAAARIRPRTSRPRRGTAFSVSSVAEMRLLAPGQATAHGHFAAARHRPRDQQFARLVQAISSRQTDAAKIRRPQRRDCGDSRSRR